MFYHSNNIYQNKMDLRYIASQELLSNKDLYFLYFINEDGIQMDNTAYESYCKNITDPKQWGGHAEVLLIFFSS